MIIRKVFKHAHLYCGSGGFAIGFNKGSARVNSVIASWRCLGGIDCDPGAIRDFTRLAGVPGTCMDLFALEQYVAYFGRMPPPVWREAVPADILLAFNNERPDALCLSAPCKGFSGLTSESRSLTPKYQALNQLAIRGLLLTLEAYKDDPIPVILFENVPRVATRGRPMLDQITQILHAYGYAVAETAHDCGKIGRLAQSRKRFLMIARHMEKVPPFIYEPQQHPLRAVGDVLGRMRMPGDATSGPMHRIPRLHWKTWVRLAFITPGKDWRDLQNLRVADGVLQDYALVPEREYHPGVYGVNRWEDPSGVITSQAGPSNGNFSVADVRVDAAAYESSQYGINRWDESAGVVTSQRSPGQGKFSVADPRIDGDPRSVQMGVRTMQQTAPAVTASMWAGTGPNSIADPRIDGLKHNNCFRVVRLDETSPSVTGGSGPSAGGLAVADTRPPDGAHGGKYRVTELGESAGTVIAESGTGNGAFAVADVRVGYSANSHRNKMKVVEYGKSAQTVTGATQVQGGALSVADPRPGLSREKGDAYLTCGHYGVVPWEKSAYAVTGSGQHDNGYNNVADVRLPGPSDQVVAIIRSRHNTWNRPFTTLELAALQSLVEPEEQLELDGLSDSAWRERIGNMVPPDAAQAMADVIGHALLLASLGETFALGSTPIWVRPIAVALSVMQRKPL